MDLALAESPRENGLAGNLCLVAILTALAWLPMLPRYSLFADDYPQRNLLLQNGWSGYWDAGYHLQGIWRNLGLLAIAVGTSHPLLYGPAIVAIQTAAACLLYVLAARLLGGGELPLALAILFGFFPWGAQAIVWASASGLVLIEALFLLNILILLRFGRDPGKQATCFVATFLLTLFAQLIREDLIYAFAVSGLVVFIEAPKQQIGGLLRKRYSFLGPVAAAILFTLLFLLSRQARSNKSPYIRIPALLSPLYYQYTNAFVFQPWLIPAARRFLFWGWNPWLAAMAILLGISAMVVWFRLPGPHRFGLLQRRNILLVLYCMILTLAAFAIYAVAGGYGLDSRKRYALIPLLLLTAASIYRWMFPSGLPVGRWLAVLLPVIGVPTTWLYVDICRYEEHGSALLVHALAESKAQPPFQVIASPDIYQIWPRFRSEWGFRFDETWLLYECLGLPYKWWLPLESGGPAAGPPKTICRYDPLRDQWIISEARQQ